MTREQAAAWQWLLGFVLIALVAAGGWWRGTRRPAPPEPLAPHQVAAWMLETAYGIGPVTAPRLLRSYREQGLRALPATAQAELRGLIADIPDSEMPHTSAQ